MNIILSTKELSENQIDTFEQAEIAIIAKNFIKTNSLPFDLNKTNQLLLFTSQNAVKSVENSLYYDDLKSSNCICVGVKTKEYLEKIGFKVVAFANYATTLGEIIEEKFSDQTFTFFSGNLRQDTLPNVFKKNKIEYNEVKSYETLLSPKEINALFDGILFFSPSGVQSFLKKNKIANRVCFCIGTTTAKALENETKNIIIAPEQTIDSVIQTSINYYKNQL